MDEQKKWMKNVEQCYKIANAARAKGYDPEKTVNIPLAKNLAERVEGLISVAIPEIANSKIPERLRELEKQYGKLDWRVALEISLETAQEKFCKFETKIKAIEAGIRIGLAYLTLGVVASPLEGFVELRIKKRKDGKEYFALNYAGPIRSAGGTAGAVSVIVADHIRKHFGYDKYDPTDNEVRRMVTELYDYHDRITNLQYLPSEKEIMFLVQHIPVQIDGDPSEKIEVSNYKDIDRIETNRIRSGACLVLGECVAQKAVKVWSQIRRWDKKFQLDDWNFLQEFVQLQKGTKTKDTLTQKKIVPVLTYIKDLVAGRPILGHPMAVGGFRLRYGRARTSGYSGSTIHPATMVVLDKYIAIGTQLKVERPGKATTLTTSDSIEGPIVKLKDNSVVKVDTEAQAKEVVKNIQEILFLGDLLFSYGDFYNRAHVLAPAGYCEEWWAQELEKSIIDKYGSLDFDAAMEESGVNDIEIFVKNHFYSRPDAKTSLTLSEKFDIPLHPYYTYHWSTISKEKFIDLVKWLYSGKSDITDKTSKIILPRNDGGKRTLELLGVPHIFINNEFTVIEKEAAMILNALFDIKSKNSQDNFVKFDGEDVLEVINKNSKFRLRDKSGTFIGARMGRPEKAKARKLDGDPHTLFPVGKEGGKMRSFQSALTAGFVEAEFPTYFCESCNRDTVFSMCDKCDKPTKKVSICHLCGKVEGNRCVHGEIKPYLSQRIILKDYFDNILKKIGTRQYPDLIKGVRGTSNKAHIPEHFAKGILRAKHEINVNKDGTTRYDMTQQPITHFTPKEIGTPIEKLREMGYHKDIHDLDLVDENQILELKYQDIILPKCEDAPESGADKILLNVANFIDELLVSLYGMKKFYNLGAQNGLVGHLVVALAPHTSAGIVGRIIGFSKTQGFFAHPLFHAATRRDCDGDEASVTMLMDALLNFSRQFLPATRGATQDAPLVLTSTLNPTEVDDMAFDLDVAWKYPLEFYEATLEYNMPWSVKIERFGDLMKSGKNDVRIGYTHPVANMNDGVKCSSYKTIPSMEDKLKGQMDLADKIRAVNAPDVARLVIEKHLLRDIRGNLRKFSMQQFRCTKCTEKYRRPPLIGKCVKCGNRLIFTVTEGAIVKYLEPAMSLSDRYDLPTYLKQNLVLTKDRVEGVFGKDKDKQEGLNRWFG